MKTYAALLGIMGTVFALSAAHGASEFTDSFKVSSESERPLDGSKVETGSGHWEATPNLIVRSATANGVVVEDAAFYIGKIPVAGSEAKILEIEATVQISKDTGENPWVAIGAGNPGRTNNSWGGGFFLLLHKDGQWAGFFNPDFEKRETILRLNGGKAVDFDAEGPNTLKIEYDKVRNLVSMWVNGAKVVDGYDLGQHNFQPDLAYAGFSGSGGQIAGALCLQDIKILLKD